MLRNNIRTQCSASGNSTVLGPCPAGAWSCRARAFWRSVQGWRRTGFPFHGWMVGKSCTTLDSLTFKPYQWDKPSINRCGILRSSKVYCDMILTKKNHSRTSAANQLSFVCSHDHEISRLNFHFQQLWIAQLKNWHGTSNNFTCQYCFQTLTVFVC